MSFIKLTAGQVLVLLLYHMFKRGCYSGREGESKYKGKFLGKINPWPMVKHSSSEKSLIYCVRNFYNLGYIYWV